ncbi:hypothetical protein T09_2268 [Trichinella sp. T9]|nr:hypothetical protein T09_2268 [Trichinella sp. T9]
MSGTTPYGIMACWFGLLGDKFSPPFLTDSKHKIMIFEESKKTSGWSANEENMHENTCFMKVSFITTCFKNEYSKFPKEAELNTGVRFVLLPIGSVRLGELNTGVRFVLLPIGSVRLGELNTGVRFVLLPIGSVRLGELNTGVRFVLLPIGSVRLGELNTGVRFVLLPIGSVRLGELNTGVRFVLLPIGSVRLGELNTGVRFVLLPIGSVRLGRRIEHWCALRASPDWIRSLSVNINAQKWIFCAAVLTVLLLLVVGQVATQGNFSLRNTKRLYERACERKRATTLRTANCSLTIASVAICTE